MNSTHGLDIHDLVTQLTRTHTNREPRIYDTDGETWRGFHTTTVPALIHQLLNAQPASNGWENPGSSTFGSRPAARLEALDTVMLIDDEASRWLARLGADDPNETLDPITKLPRPGVRASTGEATIRVIQKLHGLHPSQGATTQQAIERDVWRWWHQARICSGWDSAAWKPDNTCPICEERRSLRIHLGDQTALCVGCREVWDSSQIGLLAEWIRAENREDDDSEETPA